jgi:mRNA-degrading endonuclease toxin of MazEF toxin-antitoxin module
MQRPGQPTLRLVVSADGINAAVSLPVVFGLHILEDDPGELLAVAVQPWGWASAVTLERVLRRRLVEHVGQVAGEAMEQVDASLRAVLEL